MGEKIILEPALLQWCSTILNINFYLFAVNPIEMTEGEEDEDDDDDEEEDEDGWMTVMRAYFDSLNHRSCVTAVCTLSMFVSKAS